MPKISVIIPVYKSAKYLRRCFDSILKQTFQDFEIIIVSDGPEEDDLICQEYYEKFPNQITHYVKHVNQNVGGARNKGVELAKGEYLSFIDADDWLDLDFYEKLYTAAKKYDADIAVAGIVRLHLFRKKFYLNIKDEVVTTDYETKLKLCNVPDKSYVWNKIYKTEKFKANNLKFIEGKLYEDVILTPQILYYLNKLVTVPDTYYYYWRRPGSGVTKKDQKSISDQKWANEQANLFFKEHNIDLSKHKTTTKRTKILGITVFKTITKGSIKTYNLLNLIRWSKESSN